MTRYLKEFIEGGLAAIFIARTCSPTSKLLPHKAVIKAHFQSNPPHTASEASFEIGHPTGLKPDLSACREFILKHLGMKCRKMTTIPSKADPDRQEEFYFLKFQTIDLQE